jgi:hypothetical protein
MVADSQTVALIKVATRDSTGKTQYRVIPSKDYEFCNNADLPGGEFKWNFIDANWLSTYDALGRELFTGRHHETICHGCSGGGVMTECDYCTLVWHAKRCGGASRKPKEKELWRCPACVKGDRHGIDPVTSAEQRKEAARTHNAQLAADRKAQAEQARTRRLSARQERNNRRRQATEERDAHMAAVIADKKASAKFREEHAAEAAARERDIARCMDSALPEGVDIIGPQEAAGIFFTDRTKRKLAVAPDHAQLQSFFTKVEEVQANYTKIEASLFPDADVPTEILDGWLRQLNVSGRVLPISPEV